MALSQPASETVELYNRLVGLHYREAEQIGQIEWRLRQQRARNPADGVTLVALLEALRKAGKATEAIELAEEIWDRRGRLPTPVSRIFAISLQHLGFFERSLEILLQWFGQEAPNEPSWLHQEVFGVAIGVGDIDLLRHLAASDRGYRMSLLPMFLDELEKLSLTAHFAKHQNIVRGVVFGHQVGFQAGLSVDEGTCELFAEIFVAEPRDQRRQLEEKVFDELEAYYVAKGMGYCPWSPVITTAIFDMKAMSVANAPP